MRMFLIYINKRPVNVQLSLKACERFKDSYGKFFNDKSIPQQMQQWDKQNL